MVKNVKEYKNSSYNDYIFKRGIVTDEIMQLIFENTEDYVQTYKKIHEKEYDFADYIDNIDYSEKYKKLSEIDVEELMLDSQKLKNIIRKLVLEDKIQINKVSEVLKISRFKISRIINNK